MANEIDANKDLVDSPNETLAVEYKSWLDLSKNEVKADLARHIAAVANHGGGMVVFGFEDDLQPSGANPHEIKISRDTISAIVKKYLEPPFQCIVKQVELEIGNIHPIIIVPSHGAAPVCAKADGPHSNGKPSGITQGTYYTRKPGPESAPILSATEWAPIIRRCALHDRTAILSAIEAALRGQARAEIEPTTGDAESSQVVVEPKSALLTLGTNAPLSKVASKSGSDTLLQWHEAAFEQFKKDLAASDTQPELENHNVQYSYSISTADKQHLNLTELRDSLLLQINNEVKDRVRTGWSMIYPFTRPEIAPRFILDEASGEGDNDFIETALLREKTRLDYSVDMWRVSSRGKVTLIRPYWEDGADWNRQLNMTPGTWFSPILQVRALAEFVRHAQAFAEKFDAPIAVKFLCEWRGLKGRDLSHPDAYFSSPGFASAVGRKSALEVSAASLANGWPEIVAELIAPTIRLFNAPFQVTPAWVKNQAPTWVR